MSDISVLDLAKQINTDIDKLLSQLKEAGVDVSNETDKISIEQKTMLLTYLRQSHGKAKKPRAKISLKKKSTISLDGKKDGVSVEIRSKKKILVKPEQTQSIDKTKTKKAVEKKKPAKIEKKLTAAEIAKKLAEEKRLKQGDEARETVEEKRIKSEQEHTLKLKEEQKKRIENKKQEEQRLAEKAAERKKQDLIQKQAEKVKKEAESTRLKRLEEDAKENARKEFEKHKEREKQSSKLNKEDDIARKQAEEDYKKQVERERMGASKFIENKKAIRRADKKASLRKVQSTLQGKHKFEKPTKEIVKKEVELPETITVGELAKKMQKKANELIMVLMKMGSIVNINQLLDQDTAALLLEEMDYTYIYTNENQDEEELVKETETKHSDIKPRPPIVTIMGHVDHGKTSLLDYIRKTKVTSGEAGGITQHIGSYHVELDDGVITFLDTPGHAAFTAMRARGAKVTDIVIIVVAADDGVMPQTIEAIQHAKAAKVPIIIAINKVDKPDSDIEKVKGELAQHEILTEDWGGDIMVSNVSAHTGEGIDDLLEKILLQSEVLELEAAYKGPATAIVVESRVDKGRGAVASVLVRQGCLEKGDFVLAGLEYGRIKAMNDEAGKPILKAGPSIPVEILGLSGAPGSGEDLICVENEKVAKDLANKRSIKLKEIKLAQQQKSKLENLFANAGGSAEKLEEVNVLIKADVHGSAEALKDSLIKLSTDEVAVKIIASGTGGISESDINLAIASNALVVAFNVRAELGAKRIADNEGIDVRYYNIIYDAIDDIKQAMTGKLSPEIREEIVGIAEVKEVFKAPKIGQIAGCVVIDGYVKHSFPIRVLRDSVVIFEGELESLRRFKDEASEVRAGVECGIGVKNYNDVKVGDQIECFERKEIARTL